MLVDVTQANYLKDYSIWLKFEDGKEGIVDLKNYLGKGVFEPLIDKNYFKDFSINDDLGTITWKNGADISPEKLYELIS